MDSREPLEIVNSPVFESGSNKPSIAYPAPHFTTGSTLHPRKLAFWKVSSVGIGVGAVAGAAAGYSGLASYLIPEVLPVIIIAMFGAGYTLSRLFRIKKHIVEASAPHPAPEAERPVEQTIGQTNLSIITVVYDGIEDYPFSDTYERDRIIANAKQALLSMDHTKTTLH